MTRPDAARWFWWALAGVAALGFAIRLVYILGWHQHDVFAGDAFAYHGGANFLADGKGFTSPYSPHHAVQDGGHPPLYVMYLAVPSVLGFQSVLAHLVWSAVLGAGTILFVGLTGREVGGARLGIIAAAFAAVYPNAWNWDGTLKAESIAMFTTALTLYLAYRYWRDPTWWRLAAVGAAGGAAALSRSELVLFIPLLVVPLAVLAPGPNRGQRWIGIGAGMLAGLALMAPWLVFNLTRFEKPELLTTSFGPLLSTANCDQVWNGYHKSYFSIPCTLAIYNREIKGRGLDQSEADAIYRRDGIQYIKDHSDQIPKIVVVRVAGILGLYHPQLQINIDGNVDGREMIWARLGMYSFYVVALLSIVGAGVLRRRRTAPVFPLFVPPAVVLITVVIGYAATRFRATGEVALFVLAAVAVDAAINAVRTRRGPTSSVRSDRVQQP